MTSRAYFRFLINLVLHSHLRLCALALAFFSIANSSPVQAQTQALSSPHLKAPLAAGAPNQNILSTALLHANVSQLDLTPYAEYWIDEAKETTVPALLASAASGAVLFKPSQPTDAHRIHDKVLWLKFDVKTSVARSRWLLELGSPLIDDVRLFWRDKNGQWLSQAAGDVVPRNRWPLPTRLPTFELPLESTDAMQFVVRIENARVPVSLPMHIYSDPSYMHKQRTVQMLLGALVGLIGLMLLTSVGIALVRREQAFIACSAYLLALGAYNLTSTGLTPLYFWNESPFLADRMNYALAALTAALGPWLVRLIVQPITRVNMLNIVIAVQAVAMLLCGAAELWFPTRLSYAILNGGVLLSVVLVYAMLALTWQRGEAITRWVALCFAPVAFSALPVILRNLGAIPNSWLTQAVVPIATAIELPLLMYALLARSNMRRESLARAAGLPRQDALTGLPNMRHFLEQMNGSILRAERFGHTYGLLLVELTNHAWFVKEHGNEMADRALILTSSRLQQLMRDVDIVCRLDDSNFVILVEGACKPAQLTKLAARISAAGHASTDILPVGATLRLAVCCALMPTADSNTAGNDAQEQLAWLIAAAETLPAEQRKLVRSVGF